MIRRLVANPPRFRAAALLALAAAGWFPAFALAEPRPSFCPRYYKLWEAICLNDYTGDIVQPRTKGADYARIKATLSGGQLCGAWDLHITTQIEDFGLTGMVAADRLASAGQVQMTARTLCKEGRHAEAATLYETIFAGLD
jgi:hypothetical protein